MGADNLAQFHRWQRWQYLLSAIPIAVVFDRAPYSHTSLRSKTLARMRRFLLKDNAIIAATPAPGLQFVHLRRDPLSSTQIRKYLKTTPF